MDIVYVCNLLSAVSSQVRMNVLLVSFFLHLYPFVSLSFVFSFVLRYLRMCFWIVEFRNLYLHKDTFSQSAQD